MTLADRLARRREELEAELRENGLRERAERIVGATEKWGIYPTSFHFRAHRPITMKEIVALSVEFGTDAINFDFGESGEPSHSEVTPGCPGHAGYVQIMFPVTEK